MDQLVNELSSGGRIEVGVPASKSIFARALILAAFTEGDCILTHGPLSEDSLVLLGCIRALGIDVSEHPHGHLVHGKKEICHKATLDFGSAGTAARFLTAVLAFKGGEYEFHASEQMQARPMDIVDILKNAGVSFEFLGREGYLPFRMRSKGITKASFEVDTAVSSQFASGLLLAGAVGNVPVTLTLPEEGRTSYLAMTLSVMQEMGAKYFRLYHEYTAMPMREKALSFSVDPDLSSACYFYALALLKQKEVLVRGVHEEQAKLQGDFRLIEELTRANKAVVRRDTPEGLVLDGSSADGFGGFDLDMREFSDQALTVAAMAPFASSPTRISGISHTRRQECDRVQAIVKNLTALGVPCREEEDGVSIDPAPVKGGTVETFGDHRVTMAFSLIGLKTGGIVIDDPDCTRKTFPDFFEILKGLK